ncbi:MAG: glycine rich domain-containing protein [Candidatus Cybelea sp.]
MKSLNFGSVLGGLTAVAMLAGCGGSALIAPGVTNDNTDSLQHHHRFQYTGAKQSFKVPSGVTKLTVVARGAAGGAESNSSDDSGRGGRVDAIIPVHPGETLYVFVGDKPDSLSGGYNGGGDGNGGEGSSYPLSYGGGGASDIRDGGTTLHDRILVAGGGGGQGGITGKTGDKRSGHGGKGGDSTGGAGFVGFCGPSCDLSGGGGVGGSQRKGGSGGSAGGCWAGCGVTGKNGSLGDGGAGGDSNCGSSCSNGGNGGGGGGGYYGGGGGGGAGSGYASYGSFWPAGGGGGGGGSSYVEPSATQVQMWQGWRNATGNGVVIFAWREYPEHLTPRLPSWCRRRCAV